MLPQNLFLFGKLWYNKILFHFGLIVVVCSVFDSSLPVGYHSPYLWLMWYTVVTWLQVHWHKIESLFTNVNSVLCMKWACSRLGHSFHWWAGVCPVDRKRVSMCICVIHILWSAHPQMWLIWHDPRVVVTWLQVHFIHRTEFTFVNNCSVVYM